MLPRIASAASTVSSQYRYRWHERAPLKDSRKPASHFLFFLFFSSASFVLLFFELSLVWSILVALAASGFFLVYLLYSNIQDHFPYQKPPYIIPPELCSLPFILLSSFQLIIWLLTIQFISNILTFALPVDVCFCWFSSVYWLYLTSCSIILFAFLASGPVPLTRSIRVFVSSRLDLNLLVLQPIWLNLLW